MGRLRNYNSNLKLAAFLMPNGYFCEFAGIAENGRVILISEMIKRFVNPYEMISKFPKGQRSAIEKILYYIFEERYRIYDLLNSRFWDELVPPIQIYCNDGRPAHLAGTIPIQLRISKDEKQTFQILLERKTTPIDFQKEKLSYKFVWKNSFEAPIPHILPKPGNEKQSIPVYYDGLDPDRTRLLQRVGTENISGSHLIKYKNFLKYRGVEGLELLPEVVQSGPGLCLFLEPLFEESKELQIQGRLTIVYAKKKNDLTPLQKRKNKPKQDAEAPTLYEFHFSQIPSYAYPPIIYSDRPNGAVIKRSTKKEKQLLNLEIPIKFSRRSGEFKIPHKRLSTFFSEILPKILENNVILRLHPDLDGMRIPKKAYFHLRNSSGIDWFEGEIQVKGLDSIETAAAYAAWKAGSKFIRLEKSGWVDLKDLGFETLSKGLDSAGVKLDGNGKSQTLNKGQALALETYADLREIKALQNIRKLLYDQNGEIARIFTLGSSFQGNLRDYQMEGAKFLYNLHSLKIGGVLADEMGLGKTIQSLAYFSKLIEQKPKTRILVVAPLAAIAVWEEECAKFLPKFPISVWHGPSRKREIIPKFGIILTTYQTLSKDISIFLKYKYETILLDEAQNVKNTDTDAARSIRKLKAESIFCLTGTPLENNLDEFWALFDLVFPGLLGSLRSFQRNFFPDNPASIEELRNRTSKFLLRRRKSEVLGDLPPKTDIKVSAPMSELQSKLYEKARKEAIEILNKAGRNYLFELLPQLTKLRRLASHPNIGMEKVNPLDSGKISRFLTIIQQELPVTSSAIVFSQFTDTLAIVRDALDQINIPYFYLDGKTPAHKRTIYTKKFQNGERRFFLISLKAGGVALTLTQADTVFHLDPWWNPAVESQASDRAHRYGQKRPVFVYKLYSENSIEERVLELQEKKRLLFTTLLDSSETSKKSDITREELRELIG